MPALSSAITAAVVSAGVAWIRGRKIGVRRWEFSRWVVADDRDAAATEKMMHDDGWQTITLDHNEGGERQAVFKRPDGKTPMFERRRAWVEIKGKRLGDDREI